MGHDDAQAQQADKDPPAGISSGPYGVEQCSDENCEQEGRHFLSRKRWELLKERLLQSSPGPRGFLLAFMCLSRP